jgi:hypothetical protein
MLVAVADNTFSWLMRTGLRDAETESALAERKSHCMLHRVLLSPHRIPCSHTEEHVSG